MLAASIEKLIVNSGNSQTTLLNDVGFKLDKNQIYTIVGKNGTGKTTLIKSLTGLLDKRFYAISGKVIFEGKDLLSLDDQELKIIRRQKIKYVFQDAQNSFDQLKKLKYYFKNLNKPLSEVDETLAYFLLPKSLELYNLHAYEVSGGMAQRISLALSLLTHDLRFANLISDKIALITNGKLTKFLPPDEFFKSQENILSDNLINSYHQLTA